MIDSIFNYLDNNYIYYILFIFINVFIFKEVLIKKLEKRILNQEKIIDSLNSLLVAKNRIEKNLKVTISRQADGCQSEAEPIECGLTFSAASVSHDGSVLSPKPNPKKQAKPKKKRK